MSKRILIILIVCLILGVLGILGAFAAVRWFQTRASATAPGIAPSSLDAPATDPFAAVLSACAQAEAPEECADGARFQEALRSGNTTHCADVRDQVHRNTCYEIVALGAGDSAMCEGIDVPDARASCANRASARSAVLRGDAAVCAQIPAAEQLDCFERTFAALPSPEACGRYSDDVAVACEEFFQLQRAADARDRAACLAGAGRFQPLCDVYIPVLPAFLPDGDDDADGLTNAEEERYGANPFLADSDGDGYTDADEVKNGYNPAGPGPLNRS